MVVVGVGIEAGCTRHPYDEAVGRCARCDRSHCRDCLVHVAGPDRPPLCLPCALVAAGVRSPSSMAAYERRRFQFRN